MSNYISEQSNTEDSKLLMELFHNQLELVRYDESKDRATTDWKRIRQAIEHENTLVNHRLTWLLTSQGFLFAGFGLVFTHEKGFTELPSLLVLSVISAVGIALSVKTYMDIERAARQLSELDSWWHMKYAPNAYQTNIEDEFGARNEAIRIMRPLHPTLQLRDQKSFLFDRLLKVEFILISTWVLIILFVIGKPMLNQMMALNFGTNSYPCKGYSLVFIFLLSMLGLAGWRQAYNGQNMHQKTSAHINGNSRS